MFLVPSVLYLFRPLCVAIYIVSIIKRCIATADIRGAWVATRRVGRASVPLVSAAYVVARLTCYRHVWMRLIQRRLPQLICRFHSCWRRFPFATDVRKSGRRTTGIFFLADGRFPYAAYRKQLTSAKKGGVLPGFSVSLTVGFRTWPPSVNEEGAQLGFSFSLTVGSHTRPTVRNRRQQKRKPGLNVW